MGRRGGEGWRDGVDGRGVDCKGGGGGWRAGVVGCV